VWGKKREVEGKERGRDKGRDDGRYGEEGDGNGNGRRERIGMVGCA